MTTFRLLVTTPALAAILATAAPASAQPAVTTQVDPEPIFSLTFSPVHLVLRMFEVTGELRVNRKIGVAAVLGGGSFSGEQLGDPNDTNSYTAYEIGGQFRYYALGSFRSGLQLGAELMYLTVDAENAIGTAAAEGLTVGPFAGYKHAWSFGLTLEAQLGAQLLVVRAEADNGATAEDDDVGVLLNLNAGWSF